MEGWEICMARKLKTPRFPVRDDLQIAEVKIISRWRSKRRIEESHHIVD
jgi:hypothetical protein